MNEAATTRNIYKKNDSQFKKGDKVYFFIKNLKIQKPT